MQVRAVQVRAHRRALVVTEHGRRQHLDAVRGERPGLARPSPAWWAGVRLAGSAAVADTWSEGDAVALGRDALGFVVVNNGDTPVTTSLATCLPDGT